MASDLQSKIFRLALPEGKQFDFFKEDILFLNNIQPSTLVRLSKYTNNIILASTETEKQKISDEIIKENLIDNPEGVESFYRFINFFLEAFTKDETKDDDPEIIVKDLANKFGMKEDELSAIKKLLELTKNETAQYTKGKRRKSVIKGVFPYLKGFDTTVELRGFFNRDLKMGESLESYAKEVQIDKDNPAIPIISVVISTDAGTPDKFYFQATPEHLKLLINELESALHKSKMFRERL